MKTIAIIEMIIIVLLILGLATAILENELDKAIDIPDDKDIYNDEVFMEIEKLAEEKEKHRKQAEGKGIRLYVRDNADGSVHEIGTDSHDSLIILETEEEYGLKGTLLEYYNLQNGEGSRFGTYTFCNPDGSDIDDSFGEKYAHIGYAGSKDE